MILILTIFRVAFKALARNKMRSILTMLGIIIGVAAVIAMVSIGQGAQQTISEQIASMGSNMLFVMPGAWNSGGVRMGLGTTSHLTVEDSQAIERECPAVKYVSPSVRANTSVVFGNQNWYTNIQGYNTHFTDIRLWDVDNGSFFTEQDVQTNQRVCILGRTVAENLFPGMDPIGQEVRMRNMPWRVIGVLKSKGQSGMGQDQDDLVVAPYTTVLKKILGVTFINGIMVSAISEGASETALTEIEELLRQRHHIANPDDDDFQVRNLADMAELFNSSNKVMTMLLASIAFVSLVVGGIGVMNIMLVSVTERTREIGIRMAVGGTGGDIQFQFLTEAVVLAIIGGILGIICGIVTSKVISDALGWPTLVSTTAIGAAFTFAAVIGIAAGWYPALKASRLDPIEALRYE